MLVLSACKQRLAARSNARAASGRTDALVIRLSPRTASVGAAAVALASHERDDPDVPELRRYACLLLPLDPIRRRHGMRSSGTART